MTTIINHDIRCVDGGTVYMPPYIGGEEGWGCLAIPDVHLASAVQSYPRGTMFRKGYNSWVYTKLYTANATGGLWGSTGYGGISQGLGLWTIAKPTTFSTHTGTKDEATFTVNTQTANAFAGGLLSAYESGLHKCIMNIISNTTTVLTLDGVLPDTYTSSAAAYGVPSPYHDVVGTQGTQSAGAAFDYCPGIFISHFDEDGNDPAASDFVWLQTAGLCAMWVSGSYEGDAGSEREVVVMGDGAAQVLTDSLNETHACYQHIGILYPGTGDVTVGTNQDPADGTAVGHETHIIMLNIRQ